MYVMSKVGLRKHTRKPHTKGKTMRESTRDTRNGLDVFGILISIMNLH